MLDFLVEHFTVKKFLSSYSILIDVKFTIEVSFAKTGTTFAIFSHYNFTEGEKMLYWLPLEDSFVVVVSTQHLSNEQAELVEWLISLIIKELQDKTCYTI